MTRDELVAEIVGAFRAAGRGSMSTSITADDLTRGRAVLARLETLGAGTVTAVLWPLTWGRSQFCRSGRHDGCNTLTDSQTAPCECACHAPRPPSRDNEPCPHCGGDRLRPDFTASGYCHAASAWRPMGFPQ